MAAARRTDVSGPVATIAGSPGPRLSGMSVTSSRTRVMAGCPLMARVMNSANCPRSTASAAPAGTRVASAARMTSDPSRRISSLSSPTALSSLSARSELLHTNSAN